MEDKPKDQDDIFGEEPESKTAFNSALDIIQRISRLEYSFVSCLLERPTEDLSGAYKILILIDTEIDFKLNDEQKKELEADEGEIFKSLFNAESFYPYNGMRIARYPVLRQEVLFKIVKLRKKLSRFKYKAGLGMIDQSDPRYALLNG